MRYGYELPHYKDYFFRIHVCTMDLSLDHGVCDLQCRCFHHCLLSVVDRYLSLRREELVNGIGIVRTYFEHFIKDLIVDLDVLADKVK